MKSRQSQLSITALTLLSVFLISGCGAKTTDNGGTSASSVNLSAGAALGTTSIPTGQAICGQDVANLTDLGIHLKTHQDSSGILRSDLIVIKFDRIPSQLSDNSDSAFEVWTRTVDSMGNYGTYQQMSFFLETASGGASTPYSYTDLTWSQMQQIATYFGMTITTASQFFAQINVVAQVTDISTSTKLITPKVYDALSSYSPQVTAIAPMYAANPNEFAQSNVAAVQALHPLQSQKSQSYSTAQFQTLSNQFCF